MTAHREWFERRWNDARPRAVWIMLNPSTADDTEDDPTIRKVIGFSTRWGYGGAIVVNLYTMRATVPSDLVAAPASDRLSAGADDALARALDITAAEGGGAFCGWGASVTRLDDGAARVSLVWRLADARRVRLAALKEVGGDRNPGHPLYLRWTSIPRTWGPLVVEPTP